MPPFDLSNVIFPRDRLEAKLPPVPQSLQFRHRAFYSHDNANGNATLGNIEFPWYWTRLDHPALNHEPNAIVTVTPVGRYVINQEQRTATVIHNPHPVGVMYISGTINRWYIYNLDGKAMEDGVDFHVAIHRETA